jgi:hypothetical protein
MISAPTMIRTPEMCQYADTVFRASDPTFRRFSSSAEPSTIA